MGGGVESSGGVSRTSRGPASFSSSSIDPQDLLAMNAELSRMAKELRLEMTKMWSYRGTFEICFICFLYDYIMNTINWYWVIC